MASTNEENEVSIVHSVEQLLLWRNSAEVIIPAIELGSDSDPADLNAGGKINGSFSIPIRGKYVSLPQRTQLHAGGHRVPSGQAILVPFGGLGYKMYQGCQFHLIDKADVGEGQRSVVVLIGGPRQFMSSPSRGFGDRFQNGTIMYYAHWMTYQAGRRNHTAAIGSNQVFVGRSGYGIFYIEEPWHGGTSWSASAVHFKFRVLDRKNSAPNVLRVWSAVTFGRGLDAEGARVEILDSAQKQDCLAPVQEAQGRYLETIVGKV